VHVYGKPVIEALAREIGAPRLRSGQAPRLRSGQALSFLGSTDAGRAKWVESLANDLGVPAAFVFKRRRSAEETEVTAVSTRLAGEMVVIYDDMIRTGGSLINAGAPTATREPAPSPP